MFFFSNIHTTRRTVSIVLLVWLFAMASGWANACLLQRHEVHLHASSIDGPLFVQRTHVSPVHVGLAANRSENPDRSKTACLKVCDDGRQSVIKLASSADLTDALLALPVVFVWQAPLPPAERENAWLAFPAPSPGLPLRTRFARLSL